MKKVRPNIFSNSFWSKHSSIYWGQRSRLMNNKKDHSAEFHCVQSKLLFRVILVELQRTYVGLGPEIGTLSLFPSIPRSYVLWCERTFWKVFFSREIAQRDIAFAAAVHKNKGKKWRRRRKSSQSVSLAFKWWKRKKEKRKKGYNCTIEGQQTKATRIPCSTKLWILWDHLLESYVFHYQTACWIK